MMRTRESGVLTSMGALRTPVLPSNGARLMVARNELAATETPVGAK